MSNKCKHKHLSKIAYYHIGETNIHENGQKMTIIEYRDYYDIDVKFEDDFITTHISYDKFKRGNFKRNFRHNHIGETNISTTGLKMTIIKYVNSHDIDVQFDDGEIRRNVSLSNFKRGRIAHPSIINTTLKPRVGETNTSNLGQKMTIIAYRNVDDIDVQFEDDTIVQNVSYKSFKHSKLQNPNYTISQHTAKKYIGQSYIAKNGLKFTIIDYINSKDVTVQFEDGEIVPHISMGAVYAKTIKHPSGKVAKTLIHKSKYLGNTYYQPILGLYMTVTEYENNHNVTVQFETGYFKDHKYQADIIKGKVKHKFPYQMDDILLEKPAYVHNNIGNFYCQCSKCGYRDIWTIEEANNHKCEEITND